MSLGVRSGEDPAPDVLDSGRGPRLAPAARRRLRLVGGLLLVSFAAVAGGSQVQEWRAAEARRLAGSWQLSAAGPHGFGLEADPAPALSAVMGLELSLRNGGQQDVTVTRASAGGFVLQAAVLLPAQTRRDVVLHQELDCSADTLLPSQPPLDRTTSDPPRWPGPLQVTLTTPRGTPTITFDRPPYDIEHAAVTCDWLRSGRPSGMGRPVTAGPR